MVLKNSRARRQPYSEDLKSIMSIDEARRSRHWLSQWSGLNRVPTPLWRLPGLAQELGVHELLIKDESCRSTLGSFKALGAPIALLRLVLRRWPHKGFVPADIFIGRHADELRDFVVISATDGNHGRALAAAAKTIGCQCVIVLHKNVSLEREAPIEALGARIVRIEGNYDESVAEAARLAAENDWQVVSDTSYDGYEEIPRDVMQGYGTIADEVLEQCSAVGEEPPFSHVLLQGGVGGLAAGVSSYLHERYGSRRPTLIVVEPKQADCLYQSALLGRPARATGSVDSLMAGLSCGEASPLAWRFLEPVVDCFVTIEDSQVPDAMRLLASGSFGDVPILAGESGVAGLAYLTGMAASSDNHRAELALDPSSRVLLINTEGSTAPRLYQELVGRSGREVLEAQDRWLRNRQSSNH
ncbi:diaminopropionate ammonia-lyase [Variovorax sp. J22G21]|uniref:diaminopropionate ammonia-lyase n=1 Tax=Variovorax fucosicus TaxID=3053517 RepID=UPI002578C370|nr:MULTISPECIES: diaminopropionate ammonia-lyase [unclassified Variovorax]MDM0041743.1 diaminopropionate ammonia-lyase [Variovorax sp. J22R193]MDM0059582.1 diaminopropionate ammonia-lyase [Variovorax sp. J22G21]